MVDSNDHMVERLKVSLKTHGHGKIYFVVEMQATDTAISRDRYGKPTPVFDRGETASLFGIVIPL